jgi:hypothetical protein
MKHLTEEQIQRWPAGKTPALENHIQACDSCREAIETDDALQKYFSTEHAPLLSRNFSQRVLEESTFANEKDGYLAETAIILVSIVLAIASIWAVNIDISGWIFPSLNLDGFLERLNGYLQLMSGHGGKIGVIAITLMIIQFLDKKLLRRNLRTH